MPRDLPALLLEEGAVSADALARAQDRQREAGGALDTALLEQGALPPDVLLGFLSRAAELPVAPESAWAAGDARARRVFPSRVAERHGLAPFELEGRELALVATYPVDVGLLDEISFMLSLHLTAHVGLEWQVRELIHRLYGTALPDRLAALAARGDAAAAPAEDVAEALPAESTAAPATPLTGFARDDEEPLEPLAAALQQAIEDADPSLFEDEDKDDTASGPDAYEPAAREPEPARPAQDRTAPPRWTLEDARGAIAAASHRDDVVLSALRYARDFFEYAAVFAVTRDAVAGHDALGLEDERDRARSVAIYAADPGIFRTVIETRSPYLGPVSRDATGNEAILSGLGRGMPRTVLLYPVLLRDRPVCVLYADNGEAPVSARRLGDLLLCLSSVGPAFERIIRARKRRRRPAADAPREPRVERLPDLPPEAFEPPAPAEAAPHATQASPEPDVEVDVDVDVEEPEAPAAAAAEAGPPEPADRAPSPAALADRALDADPSVAAAAWETLAGHRRDPAMRPAIERIQRALLSGISSRATRAAHALGAIRDAEAVPLLIQALEASETETATAAAAALEAVTLQKLGGDARRWLAWWKDNRGRGRAEWLFSGLTSPDRDTRLAAAAELSLAGPAPVAYSADLPAPERERAARAWAGWWARSGHVL
jgi:hypothetical protein